MYAAYRSQVLALFLSLLVFRLVHYLMYCSVLRFYPIIQVDRSHLE